MPSVLDRQIDAFRESIAVQNNDANPADVQELVAVSLMLYDALRGICAGFDRRIAAGEATYDLNEARVVWRKFVALDEMLRLVWNAAARAREGGRRIDGIERLEQAVVEAGTVASVSPDRAEAAQATPGPCKSQAEVRDEVRRRMGA